MEAFSAKNVKTFSPTAKQAHALKVLNHPLVHRVILDGGARSGKTVVTIRAFVNACLSLNGCKMLMVRKERRAASTSIWVSLSEYLTNYVPSHVYTLKESDLECHFANGSVIYVDGLDDKERVEKIRGREYVWILVNEGTEANYDSVTVLIDRLAQVVRFPGNRNLHLKQMLVIDCNPKHPRHWLYRWCIADIDPETGLDVPVDYIEPRTNSYINLRFHRIHWSAFDNIENLPTAFIERLKNLPKIRRMRMLDGIWIENDNAVYDEFNEQIHVVEPFYMPARWKRYRGIDFGFRNPFACVWIVVNEDDEMFIYDCHYRREMLVETHADIIKTKSIGEEYDATIADWEAEQRANLMDKGIDVTPAINCKSVVDGIDKVNARLKVKKNGRPSLYVVRKPETQPVIDEFFAYCWDDKTNKEKPVDDNNHALSGIRYVVDYYDSNRTGEIATAGRSEYDEIEGHY